HYISAVATANDATAGVTMDSLPSTCENFAEPNPETVDLLAALRKEADRQQDPTPSLTFSDSPSDAHVYDLVCETEHAKRTPLEVERQRAKIDSQEYWESEVSFLKTMLMEKIDSTLRQKYVSGDSTDSKAWRDMASEYRRKLQRHGCTRSQIRERRKTVKDRKYWEVEVNHLLGQHDTESSGITRSEQLRHLSYCHEQIAARDCVESGGRHLQRYLWPGLVNLRPRRYRQSTRHGRV
ncbi:hypothetical protein LTR95_006000, partial [Oleoguttula sp. CCFEE 5521]